MTTDPFTVDDVQKARAAYFKSGNGVTTEDWRRALLAGTERLRAAIEHHLRGFDHPRSAPEELSRSAEHLRIAFKDMPR